MDVSAIIVKIRVIIVVDVGDDDRIHLAAVLQVRIFENSRKFFSSSRCLASGTVGRNKPLNRSACRPKWKADVSITENQLRRKREEYWDTGTLRFSNTTLR